MSPQSGCFQEGGEGEACVGGWGGGGGGGYCGGVHLAEVNAEGRMRHSAALAALPGARAAGVNHIYKEQFATQE